MSFSEAIEQKGIPKSDFERIIGADTQEKIEKAIKKGNSIEIHPAKDGVKVFEVKKEIVK